MKTLICSLAAGVAAFSAMAKDVHVNCEYTGGGSDGSSDKPFVTIQAAIDAATTEDGDTVRVAAGTYDQGVHVGSDGGKSRIYLTKRLTLIGDVNDPTQTIVKGAADETETGIGPNAVRCVLVASNGDGSVFRGFTFLDGHAQEQVTADATTTAQHAGGIHGASNNKLTIVADSIIRNCGGGRGGAVRNVTALRCRFVECVGDGVLSEAIARTANLFHCFITKTSSGGAAMMQEALFVNSTFVESRGATPTGGSIDYYNAVIGCCDRASGDVTGSAIAKNSAFCQRDQAQNHENCLFNEHYPFVSPFTGDYRLRADSEVATLGTAAALAKAVDIVKAKFNACGLSLQEDLDFYTSLDGVAIDPNSASPIAAGAFQKTLAVASGRLAFTFSSPAACGEFAVDGYEPLVSGLYSHATEYPAIIKVKLAAKGGDVFCLNRTSVPAKEFPGLDDTICLAYPPADLTANNQLVKADATFYVSSSDGTDDDAKGRGASAEQPFKTIQYALNRAGSGSNTVIRAAAGEYCDSVACGDVGGGNACVIIKAATRLVGAGRDATIIRGRKASETSEYRDANGCGTDAARCVVIDAGTDTPVCVQGFTLTEGRAVYGTAYVPEGSGLSNSSPTHKGGGVYSRNGVTPTVADCRISDCCAFRGGFVFGEGSKVTILRSQLENGTPPSGGLLRGTRLCGSIVTHISSTGSGTTLDGTENTVFHSTLMPQVAGVGTKSTCIGSFTQRFYNSIICGTGDLTAQQSKIVGTLLEGFGAAVAAAGYDDFVLGKANFRDYGATWESEPDFHLLADSPAFTCGRVFSDWWTFPACDFENDPLQIVAGKPVAGAMTTAAPAVKMTVAAAPAGYVSSVAAGDHYVSVGDSLNITVTADAGSLPHKGIVVNGVTNRTTTGTWTIAAPSTFPVANATVGVEILGRITDFYVATDGNDENTGYTPDAPKRTIGAGVGILSSYAAGDVVHVAEGDYYTEDDAGTFVTDATRGNYRFAIPQNLTVQGDGDVTKTVIYGKIGAANNGRGEDGARCAYLNKNAVLRNFTLKNGRSGYYSGGGTDASNINLGGAYIADDTSGIVESCIIRDCYAGRGGAGRYGTMVNCTLLDNGAAACTPVAYPAVLIGCYVDGCTSGQWCRNGGAISHCTFGPNNAEGKGPFEGCPSIDNVVVLKKMKDLTPKDKAVTHSVFYAPDETVWTPEIRAAMPTCKFVSDIADLNLDANANYAPTKGSAWVVDQGTCTADVEAKMNGRDAAGGQRVYNGAMDIGAFEYDWRGDYKAHLAGAATEAVAVLAADPSVTLAGETLTLKAGEFACRFAADTAAVARKYTLAFEVMGAGVLSVLANGSEVGSYTAGSAQQFVLRRPTEDVTLTLSYAADEANDAGVELTSVDVNSIGLVITVF